MKATAFKAMITAAVLATTATVSLSTAAGQMEEIVVEGASVPAITVSFDRSQLASEESLAAFERQVKSAASVVCGTNQNPFSNSLTPHAVARSKACYQRAVDEAMSAISAGQIASAD